MSHIPVNHPLRPTYRALAAVAGLYVFVFGVVGLVKTSGSPLFDTSGVWALGLRTNLAFALLSIVAGAAILASLAIGRNIDAFTNLWGGTAFMVVGTAMMALLRTDSNLLNFSVATCVITFIIGLLLLAAGMYGRSSSTA